MKVEALLPITSVMDSKVSTSHATHYHLTTLPPVAQLLTALISNAMLAQALSLCFDGHLLVTLLFWISREPLG